MSDDPMGRLRKGDAALLRFAAAAEILESDLWVQYNELGGIQDKEAPGGSGNPIYTAKLQNLDSDFPQYIHDNTDDEITHFTFLNAYLMSKGAAPSNPDQFRNLPGGTASGSSGKPRLTNLMQLTWDTSLVDAISQQRDADLTPDAHIRATLFDGRHMEAGCVGAAASVEVVRILISIGPTETMHFQTRLTRRAMHQC